MLSKNDDMTMKEFKLDARDKTKAFRVRSASSASLVQLRDPKMSLKMSQGRA